MKDDERYRDDLRYLKVWIAYADRVAHPAEIFRHLHKLHIGRTLALFWVAWAWVAEKAGDYKFADKLYAQGAAKDARETPASRCSLRHPSLAVGRAAYTRA